MYWKIHSILYTFLELFLIYIYKIMQKISVVGHKNPDTDCTLSAIIMAEFLQKKWYNANPYIQGKLNNETLFILSKLDISEPEIKTSFEVEIPVALVDHNEASQAPDNISELDIQYVVDHHKIDFSSHSPIYLRFEPLASTASILYKMFYESGFEISQKTAQIMLACIISDTLLFRSPTTTLEDREIAAKLQEISWIQDIEVFAMEMFTAKSNLWDISSEELIQYDYKEFDWNGTKGGIGTLETTDPGYAMNRKQEIIDGMQKMKQERNLDFIMLSIVDILQEENSTILCDDNDCRIVEHVFGSKAENNQVSLGNRISRKKQIIPDLSEYFSKK